MIVERLVRLMSRSGPEYAQPPIVVMWSPVGDKLARLREQND
jgi:hypothetical protein